MVINDSLEQIESTVSDELEKKKTSCMKLESENSFWELL